MIKLLYYAKVDEHIDKNTITKYIFQPEILPFNELVTSVAVGYNHSALITASKKLYSWGENKYGQLGLGQNITSAIEPSLVSFNNEVNIYAISCGWSHTLALIDEGLLYSFGWGGYHQLGHGEPDDEFVPKVIHKLSQTIIVKISCGAYHSAAISDIGDIYTWGWSEDGQLGHNDTLARRTPARVKSFGDTSIINVACGIVIILFIKLYKVLVIQLCYLKCMKYLVVDLINMVNYMIIVLRSLFRP